MDVLTAGVEQVLRTSSGPVALLEAVAATVRGAVAFDAWCVLTIDPASVLPTGGSHREGLPLEYMPRLLEIEARGEDALALADLARIGRRAMTLHTATNGNPESSSRYRDILVPAGMAHEMRVLFEANSQTWGAMVLFRGTGAPDFTDTEARLAATATAGVAAAIRREMVLTEIEAEDAVEGPGLLLLTPDLEPITATSSAAHWLDRIDDDRDPHLELPFCVLNSAHRARSRPGPSRTRIRTRSGRWLTLHAEQLAGTDGNVSIILEATRPVEIAALIADTYHLTTRERQVVGLLTRGYSRTEIARVLAISAHTVDDHIKRVFAKLDVRSRPELTAKLFFDHHAPRIENETPVGGSGWFLR
ncbi:LuxR C-terminal-related transcriptional regulator [Nocardia sp. JMUB6875]